MTLTLAPFASRILTETDLESGSTEGISSALMDGFVKWRLRVRSEKPLQLLSLLQSPTGHLANLSSVPPAAVAGDTKTYRVLWFPSAYSRNQGFLRVINHS